MAKGRRGWWAKATAVIGFVYAAVSVAMDVSGVIADYGVMFFIIVSAAFLGGLVALLHLLQWLGFFK